MVSLHFCSIGEFEDSACHKMVHTHGKIGMLQVTELSRDDRELILWRTGIYKRNLMTICLHHHKIEFCSPTSSFHLSNYFSCTKNRSLNCEKRSKQSEFNRQSIVKFIAEFFKQCEF